MATIDAVDLLHNFTLNIEVRRVRQANFRLWLALHIAHLAVWVGNFGLTEKQFVGVIVDNEGIETIDEVANVNP